MLIFTLACKKHLRLKNVKKRGKNVKNVFGRNAVAKRFAHMRQCSFVRSFDTKPAPRISLKPFDLDSPNFGETSTPTLFTAAPDMTSISISGRQQIAQTCKFWVTFGSQFLDNGSTDSDKKRFTVLETVIQALHFLSCNLVDIFARWPRKWGSSGPTVVYALHKWLILIFLETTNASRFKI